MERGIRKIIPDAEISFLPIADGGDGTADALIDATQGTLKETSVTDPLGRHIPAIWGILGDGQTAIIEMASASGLRLVEPERRNPLITTTYGTGELIRAALDDGCSRLIIGLGGSATNDGGAGAMQALGARLFDSDGCELPWGGAALANLATIDVSGLDPRLRNVEVLVASDVTNPLIGPEGASRIYAPQKGATPAMVALLEKALEHFGDVVKRQMGIEISDMPGAGAAGGFGGGLVAFLSAKIIPGAPLIMQLVGLEERLKTVDLILTGEGQIDGQTAYGKAPAALARAAKRHNLPVIALAGSLGDGYEKMYQHGIDAILPITPGPMSADTAMTRAEEFVENAAERALRLLIIGFRF